jgi:hypothetical protein
MKLKKVFSKIFFCLLAISVFALGSVCYEPVMIPDPPDWAQVIEMGAPVAVAMSAVAIPAYKLENIKCVTAEAFAGLQAKFGKLYVVDVSVDKDENYQFLLRRPTRQHLEIIESYKGDVTKTNDFMIKNLVVAGNENNALDDGVVFAQFNAETAKIILQGQAFLSKA